MKKPLHTLILAVTLVSSLFIAQSSHAVTAEDLDKRSVDALQSLYKTNAVAEGLSHKAKAILVFPDIVKAGLIFGGSYGEGELRLGDKVEDYYNSVSASWGLQAGGQSYSYAVFLMNDKALDYLRSSKGWEFGVGPTIVLVDEGVAKNFSTTTIDKDAYAFIFGQQGLMAGISLEGSKVSRIKR